MIYKFKGFIFNTKKRTLKKQNLTHILTPKAYKLLLLFIQANGSLVSKDMIIQKVWRGQIVCEATLYKLIQRLRKLMGDDGDKQSVIKTIHGEGYLLVFEFKKVGIWGQLIRKMA